MISLRDGQTYSGIAIHDIRNILKFLKDRVASVKRIISFSNLDIKFWNCISLKDLNFSKKFVNSSEKLLYNNLSFNLDRNNALLKGLEPFALRYCSNYFLQIFARKVYAFNRNESYKGPTFRNILTILNYYTLISNKFDWIIANIRNFLNFVIIGFTCITIILKIFSRSIVSAESLYSKYTLFKLFILLNL